MRKSLLLRLFAILISTIAISVSCQKNDNADDGTNPGGEPPVTGLDALKENTIVVNGTEKAVAHVFIEEYSGYMMVTATDNAEAESFDWLVDNNGEYVQLLLLPSLYNKEFDIMTETESFSIFSMYADAPVYYGIAPGVTEALTEGLCKFNFDGENAELFIDMKLADGNTISARAAGTYAGETPSENYIELNGDKEPLRAAFYGVEDGTAYFYFTPGDIEYFEEIEMVSYYVAVIADEKLINGETVDITKSTDTFMVFYADNQTEEMIMIESGNAGDAEGTFSIAELADPHTFAASMSIKFSEKISVSLGFEGECTNMYAVPEKANEFTYNGETSPIMSVVVEAQSDMRTIWLSSQSDIKTVEAMQSADPIKIVAPAEAFSGEPVGLSTYKSIVFEYKGSTWNYDNGSRGTLTVSLEGTQISVEFTNYNGFNGYYNGEATVIQ